MKLFPKKTKTGVEAKSNVISKGIESGYKRLQRGWADWMMKRTEKLTRRTWFLLLGLFVLSAGSYSVYLSVNAFSEKANRAIRVTPIKKLTHVTETEDIDSEAMVTSEAQYSRIKQFRRYMDSLARSPSGKVLYDSITTHRPGLMDSVRLVENYYQQLKQK